MNYGLAIKLKWQMCMERLEGLTSVMVEPEVEVGQGNVKAAIMAGQEKFSPAIKN
jgi:hypothetical protein